MNHEAPIFLEYAIGLLAFGIGFAFVSIGLSILIETLNDLRKK